MEQEITKGTQRQPVRGRFAPSPSGRMHLGNLFAALLAWLDVRSLGGEMLLRMEDLDPDRCRPAYAARLADDLDWLGLDWDLGWTAHSTEFCQSCRTARYEAAFHRLEGEVYPCYCSRKELLSAGAPHASDGLRIYDGRCRNLSTGERKALEAAGRRPAWRIRVPAETVTFVDETYGRVEERLDRDCGDFILRRSDGVFAYQLAVSVDDGAMGITRVVRGRDLLSSTPRQIWLLKRLGYPVPAYRHVPLLLGPDGRRLSKRDGDLDMGALRARFSAQALVGRLAQLAGLLNRAEPLSPRDLLPLFSWEKVGRQDRSPGEGLF